jgi:hypothetical protein
VIRGAWIGGVSTRRVDELVEAMGLSGISKRHVSKLCKDVDERVNAFLDRPLQEGIDPFVGDPADSLIWSEVGGNDDPLLPACR